MNSQPSHREFSPSRFPKNGTRLILSVDDEPGILWTRQQILESTGYDVLSAADGQQALALFDSQPVDLVLLDYLMPGMDGGTVAHEMKARKPSVPVVIVTASPISEGTLTCADCRIDKGQGPALLLEKIRQLLSIESRQSTHFKAHTDVAADSTSDGGARPGKI
jgi:CheY-like chemotaxis protein